MTRSFLETRNSKLETLLALFLLLFLCSAASAAEVGRFTQVEGQVELLKAGQAPAAPAAVETGVEEKDVIKTGAESRAQLRFLDDTTLTISPLSQVTIESYLYEPQGKRQAVLGVAQGLVHTVVAKVFQSQEPDFSVKTETAIMGVRGTEFYVLVVENAEPENAAGVSQDKSMEAPQAQTATDVFVQSGRVSMGSSNPNIKETLLLGPQQSTRVLRNRPPGPRLTLTPKDFQRLRTTLVTGISRAQMGRSRNPRELLQRLPMTPPPQQMRPGPPAGPGVNRPRLEGKAPGPAARPPAGRVQPPPARERAAGPPAAVKPAKPGEKPPPAVGKLPPERQPQRPLRPEPLKKEPVKKEPLRKEPARAASQKPQKERPQAVPGGPRPKEPARKPEPPAPGTQER